MNKTNLLLLTLTCLLLCSYDPYTDPSTSYKPIIMTRTQLESAVRSGSAQSIVEPCKIYIKDQYIYIVEKYKGVHIINNTDRFNPENVGFIHIPGCIDIAIKENILYADNAVDLIAIDISSLSDLKVTNRIEDVFPELYPPDIDYMPSEYSAYNRPDDTYIVAWE